MQPYLQCKQTATRRYTLTAFYDCAVADMCHDDAYDCKLEAAILCWLMRATVCVRPGCFQVCLSEKRQTLGASKCRNAEETTDARKRNITRLGPSLDEIHNELLEPHVSCHLESARWP